MPGKGGGGGGGGATLPEGVAGAMAEGLLRLEVSRRRGGAKGAPGEGGGGVLRLEVSRCGHPVMPVGRGRHLVPLARQCGVGLFWGRERGVLFLFVIGRRAAGGPRNEGH